MISDCLLFFNVGYLVYNIVYHSVLSLSLYWLAPVLFQCYSTSFTRETFLTAVHNSDVIEELEAVCAKVEEDIAKWRSKDAGGSEGQILPVC